MPLTIAHLRRAVIRRALLAPGPLPDSPSASAPLPNAPLAAAVARLGFVQADPIRAPARAQDLVLRHRVPGYRAGDLEHAYPALGLDEDVLYAYGFVPPATWALLHPRAPHGPDAAREPEGLAREVLAFVRHAGPTHPRALSEAFGDRCERNAWGGQSRATTRALEQLHYWGLLRVARRERGVRVYEPARPLPAPLPPEERLRRLALLVARLFAPLPEASLRALLGQVFRYVAPRVDRSRGLVAALLRTGELAEGTVDGVRYVWPAVSDPGGGMSVGDVAEVPARAWLLAPFDPVVWDRRRFEHLWGWPYRFEAYTPAARRQFGYYALPLLWADRMVGWATLAVRGGQLDASVGFVESRPRGRAFTAALDAELARVREFLALPA